MRFKPHITRVFDEHSKQMYSILFIFNWWKINASYQQMTPTSKNKKKTATRAHLPFEILAVTVRYRNGRASAVHLTKSDADYDPENRVDEWARQSGLQGAGASTRARSAWPPGTWSSCPGTIDVATHKSVNEINSLSIEQRLNTVWWHQSRGYVAVDNNKPIKLIQIAIVVCVVARLDWRDTLQLVCSFQLLRFAWLSFFLFAFYYAHIYLMQVWLSRVLPVAPVVPDPSSIYIHRPIQSVMCASAALRVCLFVYFIVCPCFAAAAAAGCSNRMSGWTIYTYIHI